MAKKNWKRSVHRMARKPPYTLNSNVTEHVTKSVSHPGHPSRMLPSLMAAKLTVAMTKTLNTNPR